MRRCLCLIGQIPQKLLIDTHVNEGKGVDDKGISPEASTWHKECKDFRISASSTARYSTALT